MAMEKKDVTLSVRRFIQFSIFKTHKFIQDYPHALIIFVILFLLHKLFPSLFLLFLSHSPVFALTSLLLGALLYYGEKEPKLGGIKERELSGALLYYGEKEPNLGGIKERELSRENTCEINTEKSDEKSEKRPKSDEEIKELEINSQRISLDSESDEKSESNISQNRSCETERFQRLTSLIERRKARMTLRHSIKRTLKDPVLETLMDDSTGFRVSISPITTPKWNPNDDSGTRYQSDQKDGFMLVPGSAPSVLLHRSPFEPGWNRNGLTGQKRVTRLDPFLVTEMEIVENVSERRLNDFHDDLIMNEIDENMLPEKEKFNDGISVPESEEDMEQNAENIEGENANPYSDTILLSEFLKLCSSQKTQPIKDKIQIEPESPVLNLCSSGSIETETETLSGTTEGLVGKEIVENAPDRFSNGEIETDRNTIDQIQNKEDEVSELESVKEIHSILEQIRAENGSVSKERDESGSIETGQMGQTGLSESEMVLEETVQKNDEFTSAVAGQKDEINSVETGQNDELNSVRTGQMGQTGQSESETEISEQNGNLIDEGSLISKEKGRLCEGVLKKSLLPHSISLNLKKLRKQSKSDESSSSSSNSD